MAPDPRFPAPVCRGPAFLLASRPASVFLSSMGSFASVNGVVSPAEEARVSILDNGFTFGDAVYETLRTYGGRPFALARHLARLRLSASRLGISIPQDDASLGATLDDLLARAANPESFIRLIVTRGVGDISYHFERVKGPTVVMAVKPFEGFPESSYTEGVALALVSVRRNHRDGPRPRHQVEQPAQQRPRRARGAGERARWSRSS